MKLNEHYELPKTPMATIYHAASHGKAIGAPQSQSRTLCQVGTFGCFKIGMGNKAGKMTHLTDTLDLTDNQVAMIHKAYAQPVILSGRRMARTANSLARHGYGSVEDGASGEKIFRLNQAGENAWRDESESFRE